MDFAKLCTKYTSVGRHGPRAAVQHLSPFLVVISDAPPILRPVQSPALERHICAQTDDVEVKIESINIAVLRADNQAEFPRQPATHIIGQRQSILV